MGGQAGLCMNGWMENAGGGEHKDKHKTRLGGGAMKPLGREGRVIKLASVRLAGAASAYGGRHLLQGVG